MLANKAKCLRNRNCRHHHHVLRHLNLEEGNSPYQSCCLTLLLFSIPWDDRNAVGLLVLSRLPNAIRVLGIKHICDNAMHSGLESMMQHLGKSSK